MKPFSLSVLILLASLTAPAEVMMVSGTVYDVGKGAKPFCTSNENNIDRNDNSLCWAATASNLFQHWQDRYYTGNTAPNGTTVGFTYPTGTQYLAIYDTFRANVSNNGGNLGYATQWYFLGKDPGYICKTGATGGGYFKDSGIGSFKWDYEPIGTDPTYQFNDLAGLKSVLDIPFQQQGVAAYLSIAAAGYGGFGHAISCWGYEADDDGRLVALYISDSDDHQFGARRLTVKEEGGYIHLSSSNPLGTYGTNDGDYILGSVSFLTDPNAVAKSGNTGLAAAIADSQGSTVSIREAVEAKGDIRTAKGISLEAGSILAGTGRDNDTSLALGVGSGTTDGTGLAANLGSMLNLRNTSVRISGFRGNGMSVQTEAYIAGGDVTVSGNSGTGISVSNTMSDYAVYLGLTELDMLALTGNGAGALYVKGAATQYSSKSALAAISRNTDVQITDNRVTNRRGAAATVCGTLVFDNNTNVDISRNISTYGDNYGSGGGGAIAVTRETVTEGLSVGEVTFSNNGSVVIAYNEAKGNGGAISVSGKLTIMDNTSVSFTGNKSTGTYMYDGGGALSTCGGSSNGEILITGDGQKVLFEGNSAQNKGGALYVQGKSLTLTNNKEITLKGNKAASGSAIYVEAPSYASATGTPFAMENNGRVTITQHEAWDSGASTADVIYNKGKRFIFSNNGTVEISNNDAKAGYIINNANASKTTSVMEIAHNGSVTFTGNKSTAGSDIYNEGALYVSADKGQSITFERGIANSGTGITYIGKDEAGNTSEGGTYVFTQREASARMQTTTAVLKNGGSALFVNLEGRGELSISHAEMSSTEFVMEWSDLTLSDILFAEGSLLSVHLGHYMERNILTLNNITGASDLTLGLSLITPETSTGLETMVLSGSTETYIDLSEYLSPGIDLSELNVSVVLDGWLGEGEELVVDTKGMVDSSAVVAKDYALQRTQDGVLYYTAKPQSETPEPATATLSLLALSALASRRRRSLRRAGI